MKCAICGAKLAGVHQYGSRTQKTPSRKYAGVLCGNCIKKLVKMKARGKVDLRYQSYLEGI